MMEGWMKCFVHVSLTILILCYFSTVLSSTALSSTTQTTTVFSYVKSTAAPSTKTKTELPTTVHDTCENLGNVNNVGKAYDSWYISFNIWFNMSFWGGILQVPWRKNPYAYIHKPGNYYLALTDKHKDIADIGENIITSDACLLNESDNCILDALVDMRKCNGDLLCRFSWDQSPIYYSTYIILDRNYTDTCESSDFIYTAGEVRGRFLNISYYDTQLGWFDAHRDGKQYVLPSLEDVENVFENCFPINRYYYSIFFLKDGMPQNIGDVPVRLRLCYAYKYYSDDYIDDYYYDNDCNGYIYARKCNGNIQFDIPKDWAERICFMSCGGGENVRLATSTLIAVITGSVLAGILVTMAIVYIRCFKKSKKTTGCRRHTIKSSVCVIRTS